MTTTNNTMDGARASEYTLRFGSGHHKIATMVTLADGRSIRFMDRVSKRVALQNAAHQLANHPDAFAPTPAPNGGCSKCSGALSHMFHSQD